LVAEHLDHLHYLNDILCLNISDLNKVLSEHLLHKLLVPLYVYSLMKQNILCQTQVEMKFYISCNFPDIPDSDRFIFQDEKKHVSVVVALFLLSQVFLIVSHGPLVHTLAAIMLMSDLETIQIGTNRVLEKFGNIASSKSIIFSPLKKKSLDTPVETLSTSEEFRNEENDIRNSEREMANIIDESQEFNHPSTSFDTSTINTSVLTNMPLNMSVPTEEDLEEEIKQLNVTDEEKEQRLALESPLLLHQSHNDIFESLAKKPFLETIINSLLCAENDYAALFALCLLYALANNQVIISHTNLEHVMHFI